MEPQKPNNPSDNSVNSAVGDEGSTVIDHNSVTPQPQVIKPTVTQPSQANSTIISNVSTPSVQMQATQQNLPEQPVVVQTPINPQTTSPIDSKPPVVQVLQQPVARQNPVEKLAIEPVETDGRDNPQWQYHSGELKTEYEDYDNSYKTDEVQKDSQNAGIIWSASEFVSHQKNTKWYVLLGIGAIVVSGILYLVTREIFSIVVVVILAIALGVFGAVKPKTLDYAIGDEGIQIGPKQFPYTTFHSFAVIDDAAIAYIQLLPQKRFMAPISIYFAPEDEKKIVDYLGEHLPLEHKKRDFTDKLASRIHF